MGDASGAMPAKDETRDLAYQLWAFVAGRNAVKVASILEHEHQQIVPLRTIQDWVTRYNWSQRAADDVAAVAPDLRYQAFSELLFAGLDGARYIRQVARGDHDHPNVDDIVSDDRLDLKDKMIRIDARTKAHDSARKARLSASIGAVDRIGFSPIGKGEPINPPKPNTEQPEKTDAPASDMRQLSPVDLLAQEANYRRSR